MAWYYVGVLDWIGLDCFVFLVCLWVEEPWSFVQLAITSWGLGFVNINIYPRDYTLKIPLVLVRSNHPGNPHSLTTTLLTRSPLGNILTLLTLLPPSNLDPIPSPPRTAPTPTENVNISRITRHSPRNSIQRDIRNRHASGRLTGRSTILVVLLNDNAVVGDIGHGDVGVGDLADGAGGAGDGLYADAVCGIGDYGVGDGYVFDRVVVAAADGADGEAMAA